MSHPEQIGFYTALVDANRSLVTGASVLEVGSYDVNGTVRSIFSGAREYVGVDLTEGPGVDVVGYGHQLDQPDGSFDIAISGECFEHDPNWTATFENMVRLTRPGGLVAFTCASRGRPEHGTRRTRADDSPGTQAEGLDYYRNLSAKDFERDIALSAAFVEHRFWYVASNFDLYFAGVRAGELMEGVAHATLPDTQAVEDLHDLMPLVHRMARLPLRPLSLALSDQRYQSVIRPYWSLIERLGNTRGLSRWQRGAS